MEYEVFRAAVGELFGRHAFDPPAPSQEGFVAQQGHLLRQDGERSLVAEKRGRVVAFTAAFVRDDAWYLASLFVHPDHQADGLGTQLLDAVWGHGHRRRLTLTDAIQPVSNGLYARRGLIPATPMLHLGGTVRGRPESALDPSAPDARALAALDRAAYGFDRAADHAYWARIARATVWRRGADPVAYSYVWPQGRIGPVGGMDGRSAGEALGAELARMPGAESDMAVAGSSRELVEVALACGLRFTRPPGLLLLSRGVPPPRGLAISGYALF